MINRVVFIVETPFNLRDYQRFGIEILQQNGFKVEVWDVTPILRLNVYHNYVPPDIFSYDGLTLFYDKRELYNKLSALRNSDFVMYTGHYDFSSLQAYRPLSKSGADYAVFMCNPFPCTSDEKSKFFIYLEKLKKVFPPTPQKILKIFFPRLPFRWFSIKPARLILASGERCFMYHYPTDANTEVLWVHTFDYDLYLKERDIPSVNRRRAVFLDVYLPFHSDFILEGTRIPIAPEKYYPLLNNFFKLIEDELGLEVIIAAHPRSHYESHPDYFGGRKWVRGQTIKLVKESKLVLTNTSAAVNFANLFYKPVIFLTSSVLHRSCYGPSIRIIAKWFGKNAIFIDGNGSIDWKSELTASKSHYDNYRRAYIKTEHSEDLPFWQIVANRLKKRF